MDAAKPEGAPRLSLWRRVRSGLGVPAGGAPAFWVSLSGRLLLLTALFVFVAEVLIYVPSIAKYRLDWLRERMEAAQIASLALEATPDQMVSEELAKELLANAEVEAVTLRRNNRRELILEMGPLERAPVFVDLAKWRPLAAIRDGISTFFMKTDTRLLVMGAPRLGGGVLIEIVVPVGSLKRDMLIYSGNILGLSIVISLFTATLVYLALTAALVRPMQRLTDSMIAFQQDPEGRPPIAPRPGARDEIGRAEAALSEMQTEVRAALGQKARLAALGAAVAKINHDLRNVLASAQLASDRMLESDDPRVRNLAPRLVAALDRAIRLCQDTLRYGKTGEAPPEYEQFDLSSLVDELARDDGDDARAGAAVVNAVAPGALLEADRSQVYRILLNLTRNAAQAIAAQADRAEPGRIEISLAHVRAGEACIRVADDGPGVPPHAAAHLFEPFQASTRPGGSGLGLAIARELARGHGGDVELERTGPQGAAFLVRLPLRRPGV